MDWRGAQFNNSNNFGGGGMNMGNNPYGMSNSGSSSYASTSTYQGAVRPIRETPVLPVIGRFVQNEQEIKANEVPMDGTYTAFIQNDFQEVYVKTWGGDGMIHGQTYVPKTDRNTEQEQDPFALIMQRLDGIEQSLNGMAIAAQPVTKQNSNQKKEGKANGNE